MKEEVLSVLRQSLKPEFLNRIDEIVVFHSLTEEHLQEIVDIQLGELNRRLADQNLRLETSEQAKALIAASGYDPNYGARPLKRAIQRLVETPLGRCILSGEVAEGQTVRVDVRNGALTFTPEVVQDQASEK